MNSLVITLWALNIFLDTIGQLAFKAAASDPSNTGEERGHWAHMLQRPWLWLGITCYIAEFVVWLAFLSLVPLSEGVLLGSINIVAIMIAGRFLFAEKLTRMRITGILLVAAGVCLVGVSQ